MMAKKMRKLVSMLLVVMIVFNLLPMSALASEETLQDTEIVEINIPAETPAEETETPAETEIPAETETPVEETEIPAETETPVEETEHADGEETVVEEEPIPMAAAPEETLIPNTIDAAADDGAVITVSGLLPRDAYVTAQPVEVVLEDLTVLAAYDITIYDGEGNVWQPGESVVVDIQTPILDEVEEVEIYHMENASAEAEYVDTVTADSDVATFTAESFSVYVIARETKGATIHGIGQTATLNGSNPFGGRDHNWTSENDGVAKVMGSGGSATVTAAGMGETTITHTYNYFGKKTETFKVTVKAATGEGLSGVVKGQDGSYYLDAKVYLLYQNQLPGNIQDAFDQELFGPSGNNAPYFTVKVNMTDLLAKEHVGIQIKDNGHWYISYQTCSYAGSTGADQAEALWTDILSCMSQEGRQAFTENFADNYIGYVLKVEDDGGHIDGIYKVNPAYGTEVYVDNTLVGYTFQETAEPFSRIPDMVEEKYQVTWEQVGIAGTYTEGGRSYRITLNREKSNAYDASADTIAYTTKNTNFYVARFYYDVEDITPTAVSFTLNKADADNMSQLLSGAQFRIVDKDGEVVKFTAGNGTYTYDANGTAVTLTTGSNGSLSIRDLPVGAYYMEETQAPKGYIVSNKVYKLNVGVQDSGSGLPGWFETLFGSDTTAAGATFENGVLTITNKAVTPAITVITGTKYLSGRTLNAGEFTFALTAQNGAPMPDATTATNDADGSFAFGSITYTAAGTYAYTVTERKDSLGGVTYDESVYTVTVTVTDNGDGTLTAQQAYTKDGAPASSIQFNNSYSSQLPAGEKVSVALTANKTLNGKTLTAGAFSFQIKDADGTVVKTATNAADGSIAFDVLDFTAPGTYTYTVSEAAGADTKISYDNTSYSVTITVSEKDDGDGTKSLNIASVKVDNQEVQPSGGKYAVGSFTNTYTPDGASVSIQAAKTLTGRDINAGEFSFRLETCDEQGVWDHNVAIEAQNDASGAVAFPNVMFGSADVGAHCYKVSEVAGSVPGVTYDATWYLVKVEVTYDSAAGTLSAAKTIYKNGDFQQPVENMTFANSYESSLPQDASVALNLTATKVLTNATLTDGQFSFVVKQGDTQVAAGTNDADGAIDFSAIEIAGAGEHTYTVTETAGTSNNITYDNTTYAVTVAVSEQDNGDGTKSLVIDSVKVDGTEVTAAEGRYAVGTFTNVYSSGGTGTTSYTVTVNYYDQEGNKIAESHSESHNRNYRYDVTAYDAIAIEGYTYVETTGDALTGALNGDKVINVYYAADETDLGDDDVPMGELPDAPGTGETEDPGVELEEPDVPMGELPEGEVPLVDVPATGDSLTAWIAAAVVTGAGLVWLVLTGRKRQDNEA